MSLFSILRRSGQNSGSGTGASVLKAGEESQPSGRKRKSGGRREAVDPALPEKKRARRRLVGAVALVLAAIVGLPMVLDSEPRPIADDVVIQIPARDTPLPETAISPDAALAALDEQEELVDPALPDAATASRKPVAVPSETAAPLAVRPSPAPAAPSPTPAPARPAAEKASVQAPTGPTETKPVPRVAGSEPAGRIRSEDGARALALLEGRADPRKAAVQPSEKYVVQIAALVSQEKVNELQDKLRRAGIASFTQKVATEGGEATRVRVGPFTSRDEAERMRSRIVELGLNGTLISS